MKRTIRLGNNLRAEDYHTSKQSPPSAAYSSLQSRDVLALMDVCTNCYGAVVHPSSEGDYHRIRKAIDDNYIFLLKWPTRLGDLIALLEATSGKLYLRASYSGGGSSVVFHVVKIQVEDE